MLAAFVAVTMPRFRAILETITAETRRPLKFSLVLDLLSVFPRPISAFAGIYR